MRSESQKAADKKYESKRLSRYLTWTFIAYPDSAPEGWIQQLRDTLLEVYISPLHDKDRETEEDEDLKKPHWHVMITFPNPGIDAVKFDEFRKRFNGARGQRVESKTGLARYFTHLDHPHKYQYDPNDTIYFGGGDYFGLITSTVDETRMFKDMRAFIRENQICSLADFWDFCDESAPDWSRLLDRKMYGIERYIKSYAWSLSQGARRMAEDESTIKRTDVFVSQD